MAARTERDTLNGLIETCRDAARGFRLAADHVGRSDLKSLFAEAANQREVFAAELVPYAQRLGGPNAADGTTRAAIHRGWMTLKDAWTQYDDDAVLAEARRGEAVAASAYAEAVAWLLPPDARTVIERQHDQIRDVQRRLEALAARPV